MKVKKFLSWVLCVIALVLALFLPYSSVFAVGPKVSAGSNYDDLAKYRYYLQAADACIRGGFRVPLTGRSSRTSKEVMDAYNDLIHLKINDANEYAGDAMNYDSTRLYSAYLEVSGKGKYDDGIVYCRELGFDPGAVLLNDYSVDYSDLICGKDGKKGLFNVNIGYTVNGSKYEYYEDAWPTAYPATTDVSGDNDHQGCKRVIRDLEYYTKNPEKNISLSGSNERHGNFYVGLTVNEDFDFVDFFEDYTGDLSLVDNELLDAEQFLNFAVACGNSIEKSEYLEGKNNYNSDELFEIYHNGKIGYYYLGSDVASNRTYANGDVLNKSDIATCKTIATNLAERAEEQRVKSIAEFRAQNIVDCYNTASKNKDLIDGIREKIDGIYRIGNLLIRAGETYKNNSYKSTQNSFSTDYASTMNSLVDEIKELIGNSEIISVDDVMDETRDFYGFSKNYSSKELSEDEKKEFDDRLNVYRSTITSFKDSILNKYDNKAKEAPSLVNYKIDRYRNCLKRGSCADFDVPDKVDGFYSIRYTDSDDDRGLDLTCHLNESMTSVLDDLAKILGTTINSDEFNMSEMENLDDESGEVVVEGERTCMTGGGMMSLGWIACPVLEWMSKASTDFYMDYVAPNLLVQPSLFTRGGQSGLEVAWGTFRDIANIVFVILLLAVILSQLTGYGIDNYGIKKILPKLIISAILVNLSYFICVLCVDVSNIVGNAMNGFFDGLGDGLSYTIPGVSTSDGKGGTITSVALLAGLFTVYASASNPAILLTLLLSAFSVLTSIFLLFLFLAGRKAVIVVLTVISPVAFVLYILPNTKKYYDRWYKLWLAMLMLYPICGLLVGGGDYVSKLLLSVGGADGGDSFEAFTAMIVGVLPVFFIPELTKDAFAGLGRIGAKITGWGEMARSGIVRGARNNRVVRNLQKVGSDRAERIALQRRAGGYIGVDGRFHERGLRNRFARSVVGEMLGADVAMGRAREEYIQSHNTRENERARLDFPTASINSTTARARAESSRDAQELKLFQDQFAGYSRQQLIDEATNANTWLSQPNGAQRMSALIKQMEASGLESNIMGMLSNVDVSRHSAVMQTLANSNNKVLKAYGKTAGENVSYQDFMNGTGTKTMQQYAKDKGGDFVNNLDDKALQEINRYSNASNQIMSTDQLVSAARRMDSDDSLKEINAMLEQRSDISFSGEDFINFNDSTINTLENLRLHGTLAQQQNVGSAIIGAVDSIARSPEMISRLKDNRRNYINNNFMSPRNLDTI